MSVNTVQTYLDLISSTYTNQPDFNAVVSLGVAPAVQIQQVLSTLIPLFDLDTPPVGTQLDIIGEWVGVSRNIAIPITGVFFTWDGAADLGWDFGVWPNGNQTSITTLPDSSYLTLIRATIAANNWDGTTEGAYDIWDNIFPELTIGIQDNCDMSFDLIVSGAAIDSLTLALITGGYIQLRPEGVEISVYYTSQGGNPIFAWDVESTLFQGWDEGYWATAIAPT